MSKDWKPINGIVLEDNALNAVKYDNNCFISAGPGAGKSELLIQKAHYILDILIPNTYSKILAVSFTRAAAKNLRERINEAFPSKMINRVVSTTFDSFCLDIYLQFKQVLDDQLITKDVFKIDLNAELNFEQEFLNFASRDLLNEYGNAPDYRSYIKLPLIYYTIDEIQKPIHKELVIEYIKYKIAHNELTYEIIKQLALLIIKSNKDVVKCIRATYKHIFVDEFQDTNNIQYYILKNIFLNSDCKITCVGDLKQSIYSFAGANNQIINYFFNDFHASPFFLIHNYRSQSSIVKLVNTIGKDLDKNLVPGISKVKNIDEKEQELIKIDTSNKENNYIYNKIKMLLTDGIKPREIAIFGKQKVEELTNDIVIYLNSHGIKTRYEDKYINFLEEDFFKFCFSLIILSLDRNPDSFNFVVEIYYKLYGEDFTYLQLNNDLQEIKIFIENNNYLNKFFDYVISYYQLKDNNIFNILSLTKKFETEIRKLQSLLSFLYRTSDELLNNIWDFIGNNYIPILTIHKSKGLQYDSVFFIGMENSQFYKFNDEAERIIFVAISRAKRNLYITCGNWRNKFGNKYTNIELEQIIEKLENNGLNVIDDRTI